MSDRLPKLERVRATSCTVHCDVERSKSSSAADCSGKLASHSARQRADTVAGAYGGFLSEIGPSGPKQ